MEYKVAPSLLAADFTRLGEQVHEIEEAGAPYLHLDVMDGAFVPSISFGMPVLKSLRKVTNMTFDVHMMVEEPGRYIEDIKKAGADIITVHAEGMYPPGPRCKPDQGSRLQSRCCLKSSYSCICTGMYLRSGGHGTDHDCKSRFWRPEIYPIYIEKSKTGTCYV